MLFSSSQNTHDRISRALDKLSIEMDKMQRETDSLFKELSITPEQLNAFMAKKKESVSDADWQTLLEKYKEWDHKLELALKEIRDPKKMKSKYSDLHQIHQLRGCLFVR